ncbi:MAG: DUF177 domain-containing protein [Pseudothermotoga sp.]|nr:DUF177 domain-containing protein [Pseudothermotoga sp.]
MNWTISVEDVLLRKRVILQGVFEAEYVDAPGARCRVVEPIKVKIVVVAARDGIAVGGYARTTIEHPCDRCLKPVFLPIHGTIEALYKPVSEMPVSDQEELKSLRNVLYYDSDQIDLTDRIIEAIVVEIPMKVLCSDNCKGLCPYCGANLNEEKDHKCIEDSVDPRWKKLFLVKQNLTKEG